jgi:hypothetical protein
MNDEKFDSETRMVPSSWHEKLRCEHHLVVLKWQYQYSPNYAPALPASVDYTWAARVICSKCGLLYDADTRLEPAWLEHTVQSVFFSDQNSK